MKKILLATDAGHFSKGAFDFACLLNEQEPILLAGVFLPQIQFAETWSYGMMGGNMYMPLVEGYDPEILEQNIAQFEALCQKNGIEYRVHNDQSDAAMHQLKKETRFADLLIVGSETFYENLGTDEPNEYLTDTLHRIECPIIVVPEHYGNSDNNILAYDGSAASLFAIKQFAYLFPELAKNETLLVYAKNDDDTKIPDREYIEELAARHFTNLTIMKLMLDPQKYLATWMWDKQDSILICGSFGRSSVSRLFQKSFIVEILKEQRMPVFIAHQS